MMTQTHKRVFLAEKELIVADQEKRQLHAFLTSSAGLRVLITA